MKRKVKEMFKMGILLSAAGFGAAALESNAAAYNQVYATEYTDHWWIYVVPSTTAVIASDGRVERMEVTYGFTGTSSQKQISFVAYDYKGTGKTFACSIPSTNPAYPSLRDFANNFSSEFYFYTHVFVPKSGAECKGVFLGVDYENE